MTEEYQPLSVREGKREPLPYSEGVPKHIGYQVDEWTRALLSVLEEANQDAGWVLIATLQIPFMAYRNQEATDRVIRYCHSGDTEYLDVLDFLLGRGLRQDLTNPRALHEVAEWAQWLDAILQAGRSVWTVVDDNNKSPQDLPRDAKGGFKLVRRVPQTVEQQYLDALDLGGAAGDQLVKAWHAAYGLKPDAQTVWTAAVKAVEAALQPLVEPKNNRARLGGMRKKIQDAPGKWACDLPVWDDETLQPVEAFVQVLNRVTYDPGRHGGDGRGAQMPQAQAVLQVAVTIVEWVRTGAFRATASGAGTGP